MNRSYNLVSKLHKITCKLYRRRYSVRENYENIPELASAYVPSNVKLRNNDYFQPPILNNAPPFTLVLPPPNITGNLHLGHAFTAAVQDAFLRWKRMQGIETMWVPGMDHAGIATQVVVEKKLWQESRVSRHDLGRKKFLEEVWKWKEEKARSMGEQLRNLNVFLNWEREVFTLDQARSTAVTHAFIKLFESGLIYRADQLVNWSCILQSAISDIEVDHLSINGPTDIQVPSYDHPIQFGHLTYFAYKLHNSEDEIVVATTRPETILGDVAVAVHPKDERYSKFIGQLLWHPFRNQTIPIVGDELVEPDFGTGAVKITPAHDHFDFDLCKRNKHLEIIQVIDASGRIVSQGNYNGLKRFEARAPIIEELKSLHLFRKIENHEMLVPICSRSKDVIEFLVRPQWFVECHNMAAKAVADVKEARLSIEPQQFEKIWFNWLENIRPWCISRQLWWGHRVPAYLCWNVERSEEKVWVAAENELVAKGKAAAKLGSSAIEQIAIEQDEDVLDTWFSSALQPFSVFEWPQKTPELVKYYPINLMETGHDILFFWVARMVMLGTELTGKLPFDRVLLHGIICDSQGRKMSKSLGNVIAPEDIINGATLKQLEEGARANYELGVLNEDELKRAIKNQKKAFPQGIPECGSDALRFTLLSHNIKNHFINFDVNECHQNKLFCNKIWQATRFTKLWFNNTIKENQLKEPDLESLSHPMDKWILSRLAYTVEIVNSSFDKYDFHVATAALKNLLYYDFCDVYLESTKRGLRTSSNSETATGHCWTLLTCLDVGLRLLAPFMPALVQHLHQHLPGQKYFVFPQTTHHANFRKIPLEKNVEDILEVVRAIRRLKKLFNISGSHAKCPVYIVSNLEIYGEFSDVIEDLSVSQRVISCSVLPDTGLIKGALKDNIGNGRATVYIIVPEQLRKAIEQDEVQMEKKRAKLVNELDKVKRMIAGKTYLINATTEAQAAHQKKIETLEDKLHRLDYLSSFAKQSAY